MDKERSLVKLVTLSVFVCYLVGAAVAQAATFTVNSTVDAFDATPGDGICAIAGGVCTLRAAANGKTQTEKPIQQLKVVSVQPSSISLPGRRVHSIGLTAADSARLFSATQDGLFVSADHGISWAPIRINSRPAEVFSVAVPAENPRVIYAGQRDGLWLTRDGGTLWTLVASPTTSPYIPLSVATAPSRSDIVYMATARHGIYRSQNGGASWSNASVGMPQSIDGKRLEEIPTLTVHPRSHDAAYLAHQHHGVFRTIDGGASWHPFNEGLPLAVTESVSTPQLAFDLDHPERLYLLLDQRVESNLIQNRLYVTATNGRWVPLEVELPSNTRFVNMSMDRDTRTLRIVASNVVVELLLPDLSGARP